MAVYFIETTTDTGASYRFGEPLLIALQGERLLDWYRRERLLDWYRHDENRNVDMTRIIAACPDT